jgi:16S rRNA processing protein RimM
VASPKKEDCIALGKVTKAHGIRGELKVFNYSGDSESLVNYATLLLDRESGMEEYEVTRLRPQAKQAIVELRGVDDRNKAEELIGCEVLVERDQLAELSEDEFYLHDLIGRQVMLEDGRRIGEIRGFLEGGAQDILRVAGEREYLIPLVTEFIVRFDDQTVVMQLPPGLLDI